MIASDHEQDKKPQGSNDHTMKTTSLAVNCWLDYIVRLFYFLKHSVRTLIIPLLSIMTGILVWQGLTQDHADVILNFSNIPSPLHVYKSFLNVVITKTYWKDIYWSLYRIALAFTIGSLVGIAVGVALGYSAILRLIIAPYIEIMRPIPAIAWVPMSILMWQTTEQSIVFITFLGAVFPIILNTWDGVKRVPIELVKAARSLGANRISVLFHVVIPYAIPNITVGMSLGMGAAWFALLAGEMISGRYGIGYFTWESYELIQYGNIVVGMLTIGILSSITSGAIYLIKRKIIPWSE
jgi:NitT/TauT family transport system permease protein